MPYLQSSTLPRDAVKALAANVSEFGDLICPHCRCRIITPPYAMVKPGWGRCPRCHGRFALDEHQAHRANVRAASIMAGKVG